VSADELLEQARRRLDELEEAADELGERIELAPGEHFLGRFRGAATMVNKEGETIEVVGFWDEQGRPRFHYRNAAIVAELDALAPLEIGAEIVLIRGEDHHFETKDGQPRTMHRYSMAARPSSQPLPGAESKPDDEDDVPF
jgi:hypothetical protein